MKEGEAKAKKRRKLRNPKMASFQGRAPGGVIFRAGNFVIVAKTFILRMHLLLQPPAIIFHCFKLGNSVVQKS
jgi:hypothetical protein